jgi:hypothetical protein
MGIEVTAICLYCDIYIKNKYLKSDVSTMVICDIIACSPVSSDSLLEKGNCLYFWCETEMVHECVMKKRRKYWDEVKRKTGYSLIKKSRLTKVH